MLQIFDELIKLSKADCAVYHSSVTQTIICSHKFDENSEIGKQVLRLLQRVSKVKQIEFCPEVSKDPLFQFMEIRGSFICYPLISEEDTCLGAIFINASDSNLQNDKIQKLVKILTDCHYEDLRNQTREEVESQVRLTSQRLQRYLSMGMSCGGRKIVGIDPIMEEQVFSSIEMYKTENCSPVLIYGESGTGKELVASALHYKSERHNKTYLRFNCAEIASADPQLQRIELFGCGTGVATGVAERKGLFTLANHGTLFLDEIGLLSLEAQGQLLRVLEDNKVRPVGEKNDIEVNVRLIYANNKPLQELVAEGLFREDLFYRICSFIINIPPLRQRGISDHNLLIDYFIEEENDKTSSRKKISKKARTRLHQHSWPGNVRELRATIRRAFYKVRKKDGVIREKEIEFITHNTPTPQETQQIFPHPWQKLQDIEKEAFRQACVWASSEPKQRTQGIVAEMLGIHPNTMTKKLREYGLSWPKSQ